MKIVLKKRDIIDNKFVEKRNMESIRIHSIFRR